LPVARYFIFVGGTLAALLFIPGWLLPKPPAMFADQSVALDRAVIRIKSAHQWPEKVILNTAQLTIAPPVVMDPPTIQSSIPPPPDKAPDQPNLEAMALLKPDTQPTAINQFNPANQNAAWQGPVDRGAWPEVPLQTGEQKWAGAVASLGGLMAVNQARMPCRPGALRRHGPWIEVRSIGRN
jgi:hypothetical protein